MSNNLIVISPSLLTGDHLQIVNNAIRHVESYAGKFRSVDIVTARGQLVDMVAEAEADRVLLLGQTLAGLLPPPSGTDLDAVHRFGILRFRGDERWIASPHPVNYCVEPGVGGKRKSAVVAANLIGHLIRHLELLHWGHVGWDEPTAPVRTRIVRDAPSLRAFLRMVEDSPRIAIDTETHDLRRLKNQLLTIQMGGDGHDGWVLPVGHAGSPLDPSLLRRARGALRDYFENADTATHVYCFHPHTMVQTETGPMSVEDLVGSDHPPRVYSFNHDTNEVELADIEQGIHRETEEDMIEIDYEGGTICVTADHPVWSATRGCYIRAEDIRPDEEVVVRERGA